MQFIFICFNMIPRLCPIVSFTIYNNGVFLILKFSYHHELIYSTAFHPYTKFLLEWIQRKRWSMPSFSACVHFNFTVFKLIQCWSSISFEQVIYYLQPSNSITWRKVTYLILNVFKNMKKLYALEKKNILRLVVISTS